jgi:predicted DNA-binding transcriptional regulator AlpA
MDATEKSDPNRKTFSISEFMARHGLARSTVYEECHRGRLRILKIGRKSVIHVDDEAKWLGSLPALK